MRSRRFRGHAIYSSRQRRPPTPQPQLRRIKPSITAVGKETLANGFEIPTINQSHDIRQPTIGKADSLQALACTSGGAIEFRETASPRQLTVILRNPNLHRLEELLPLSKAAKTADLSHLLTKISIFTPLATIVASA